MPFRPEQFNPVQFADWVEFQALKSAEGMYSLEGARSEVDADGSLAEEADLALREGREFLEGNPYDASELLLSSVRAEIGRRASILTDSYPFVLQEGVIRRVKQDAQQIPYIVCLVLATNTFTGAEAVEAAKLFEHLSTEALRAYIGSDAIRFGAPRDTLPARLTDALDYLEQVTKERRLKQAFPITDQDKDLGVDVIAWRPFADGYINKLQVYMQCGISEDEWSDKRSELDTHKWSGVIYSAVTPLKAMAIPFVIGEHEWERVGREFDTLLLDRLRIVSMGLGRTLPQRIEWAKWYEGYLSQEAIPSTVRARRPSPVVMARQLALRVSRATSSKKIPPANPSRR